MPWSACRPLALLSVGLLIGIGLAPAPAAARFETLEHDGRLRGYHLVLPDDKPQPGGAILLLLHGGNSSGAATERYVPLSYDRLARANLTVVLPDAASRNWNDGRVEIAERAKHVDDAGFLLALAAHVASRIGADPKRLYAAGISNGGLMSLRLACDHADRLLGIGVVAMQMAKAMDCRPSRPVPVVFFLGTADRLVPLGGGRIASRFGDDRGSVVSAAESVAFWRRVNGCSDWRTGDLPRPPGDDPVTVQRGEGVGCRAPVLEFMLRGGGHAWPGARHGERADRILGRTTQQIDAISVMLDLWGLPP